MDNTINLCVRQIALSGIEGCTLPDLWIYIKRETEQNSLSDKVSGKLILDDFERASIFHELLLSPHLSHFTSKSPLPFCGEFPYDTFCCDKLLNEKQRGMMGLRKQKQNWELLQITSLTKPITQLKGKPRIDYLVKILKEYEGKGGNYRMVASQELRNSAIGLNGGGNWWIENFSNTERTDPALLNYFPSLSGLFKSDYICAEGLSDLDYALLEFIGKKRRDGYLQSDLFKFQGGKLSHVIRKFKFCKMFLQQQVITFSSKGSVHTSQLWIASLTPPIHQYLKTNAVEVEKLLHKKDLKKDELSMIYLEPFKYRVYKLLLSSKNNTLIEKDLRNYLGLTAHTSHRWVTFLKGLLEGGNIEAFHAKVDGVTQKCIKLLPYNQQSEDNGEDDEAEDLGSALQIGCPIARTIYNLIDESKNKGITQPELKKLTGIAQKSIGKVCDNLIRNYGISSVASHIGKNITYKLFSSRYSSSMDIDDTPSSPTPEVTIKIEPQEPPSTPPIPSCSTPVHPSIEILPRSPETPTPNSPQTPQALKSPKTPKTPQTPKSPTTPNTQSITKFFTYKQSNQNKMEIYHNSDKPSPTGRKTRVSVQHSQRREIIANFIATNKVVLAALVKRHIETHEHNSAYQIDTKTVYKLLAELERDKVIKISTLNIPSMKGSKSMKLVLLNELELSDPIVQHYITSLREQEIGIYDKAKPEVFVDEANLKEITVDRLSLSSPPVKSTQSACNGVRVAFNYGWIRAKMIRAKYFHLFIFSHYFNAQKANSVNISQDDPPIHNNNDSNVNINTCYHENADTFGFLVSDIIPQMPLELYLQVVGQTSVIDNIEEFLRNPMIKVCELPDHIRSQLFEKRYYIRRVQSLIETLKDLKLLTTEIESTASENIVFTKMNKQVLLVDRSMSLTENSPNLLQFIFTSYNIVNRFWTVLEDTCKKVQRTLRMHFDSLNIDEDEDEIMVDDKRSFDLGDDEEEDSDEDEMEIDEEISPRKRSTRKSKNFEQDLMQSIKKVKKKKVVKKIPSSFLLSVKSALFPPFVLDDPKHIPEEGIIDEKNILDVPNVPQLLYSSNWLQGSLNITMAQRNTLDDLPIKPKTYLEYLMLSKKVGVKPQQLKIYFESAKYQAPPPVTRSRSTKSQSRQPPLNSSLTKSLDNIYLKHLENHQEARKFATQPRQLNTSPTLSLQRNSLQHTPRKRLTNSATSLSSKQTAPPKRKEPAPPPSPSPHQPPRLKKRSTWTQSDEFKLIKLYSIYKTKFFQENEEVDQGESEYMKEMYKWIASKIKTKTADSCRCHMAHLMKQQNFAFTIKFSILQRKRQLLKQSLSPIPSKKRGDRRKSRDGEDLEEDFSPDLPASVDDIFSQYNIFDLRSQQNDAKNINENKATIVQDCLKVILLTPEEEYDPLLAEQLLKKFDQSLVNVCFQKLRDEGIIVKARSSSFSTTSSSVSSKSKRSFSISSKFYQLYNFHEHSPLHHQQVEIPFSYEFYQRVAQFQEDCKRVDSMEFNPTSNGSVIASILTLLSLNQIELQPKIGEFVLPSNKSKLAPKGKSSEEFVLANLKSKNRDSVIPSLNVLILSKLSLFSSIEDQNLSNLQPVDTLDVLYLPGKRKFVDEAPKDTDLQDNAPTRKIRVYSDDVITTSFAPTSFDPTIFLRNQSQLIGLTPSSPFPTITIDDLSRVFQLIDERMDEGISFSELLSLFSQLSPMTEQQTIYKRLKLALTQLSNFYFISKIICGKNIRYITCKYFDKNLVLNQTPPSPPPSLSLSSPPAPSDPPIHSPSNPSTHVIPTYDRSKFPKAVAIGTEDRTDILKEFLPKQIRPWSKLDGTINVEFLNNIKMRILRIVLKKPGIYFENICNQMPGIGNQSLNEVLQAMVGEKLLYTRSVTFQTPSLFSSFRHCIVKSNIEYTANSETSKTCYFPHTDSIMRASEVIKVK